MLAILTSRKGGMIGRILQVLVCLFIGEDAWAKPLFTATCEEPHGPRIDYGEELFTNAGTAASSLKRELKHGDDSFSGVRPVFIVNDDKSMTVLWGDTQAPGLPEDLRRPQRAEVAIIIHQSEEQITAVVQLGKSSVWLYSLYPQLGYGLYTRNAHHVIGHHLVGSMMYSKCQFSQ